MRAWLLRVLALAVPVIAAYVAASIAGSSLPTDAGWWWLAVVAAGVIAAGIAMRLTSRFQLLAMAYEVELLFPGPTPQRSEVVDLVRKPDLLRTASGSATEAAARVVAMVLALRHRHARINRHPNRVAAIASALGKEMNLDPSEIEKLRWAALSYEIGKLPLPAELSVGELSIEQAELLTTYPGRGIRMLGTLSEWLGPSAAAVAHHTESWDGTGYPDRLRGEEIPLPARVVAVAVAFDQLTSGHDAVDIHAARRHIAASASFDFDPAVVRALLRIDGKKVRAAIGRSAPVFRRFAALRPGPAMALVATFLVITGIAMAGALLPASISTVRFDELLAFLETTSTISPPLAAPTTSIGSLPAVNTTIADPATSIIPVTVTTVEARRPGTTTSTTRGSNTTTTTGTTTTVPNSTTTTASSTTTTAAGTTTSTQPPATTTTQGPPPTTTTTSPPPTTTTTAPPPTTTTTAPPPTTTTLPEPTTTTLA